MYQHFYRLSDIPFSLAPDPRYLFRTESMLEVLANLRYGIENGKGLVAVTGEVGTGKTTILRTMLQSLDRSVLAAYVFNPILKTDEFFDLLASEFRLRPQRTKADLLRVLGHLLISRGRQGLKTVLVVDEAHLLPGHLMEEIRLLSNFETNREKLLQIILCGQPELHNLLSQPELRQLKQRISLKCSVQLLSRSETAQYIRWRLRQAGAANFALFLPEAVEMIHDFSGGIPRIINNICDNALLTGFSEASSTITASIVSQVVELLDLSPMDVISPGTVGEAIAGGRPATQGTASDCAVAVSQSAEPGSPTRSSAAGASIGNLRYIRPEVEAEALRETADAPPSTGERAAASESSEFIIRSEEPVEDSRFRFFSRVRAVKRPYGDQTGNGTGA